MLVVLGLAIVWRFFNPPAARPMASKAKTLDNALFAAVRDGDHAEVRKLLDQGASIEARDAAAATPLMHAALNSDKEMVRLLLERGADADARRPDNCSPLRLAIHDPDKVRLLLAKGARVDTDALLAAATSPGARPTLELLLGAGGSVAANVEGYTPLTMAARSGDLDTVRFLIDRGASAKARGKSGLTPLIGASLFGNADMVRLLLEKGAEPDVRQEIFGLNHQVLTPVIEAVIRGRNDSLRLLLDRKANVNDQGGRFQSHCSLAGRHRGRRGDGAPAAGRRRRPPRQGLGRTHGPRLGRKTRPEKRDRKAPPRGKRRDGDAASRTQTNREHRAALTGPVNTDQAAISAAVARTIPLLQTSARKFTARMSCVSCHHQSMVGLTVSMARARGFPVDEKIVEEERASVLEEFRSKPGVVLGHGPLDPLLAPWTLWSLGAEKQEPSWVTDCLVQYLIIHQRKDGSWRRAVYRPPSDASDFTSTALAVRGLQFFAPKGRCREIEGRIAKAREWLLQNSGPETEDKVMRLLGLGWTDAGAKPIEEAVALLLSEQREDGGWSQLPSLAADAYATGEVLYALHEGGKIPVSHPAFQRGLAFLLRTQLADGSWLVPTRSYPIIEYFNSGFPHGKAQFISTAGTCWATMALELTIPGKDEYPALACAPDAKDSDKPAGKVPLASSNR